MPLLTVIPQRTAPIPLSAAELGTHSLALLPALKCNVHGLKRRRQNALQAVTPICAFSGAS